MSERARTREEAREREQAAKGRNEVSSLTLALTHGRSLPPAAILCSLVDPAFPAGPRENIGRRFPAIMRLFGVVRATETRCDRRSPTSPTPGERGRVAMRTDHAESAVHDTRISRRAGQYVPCRGSLLFSFPFAVQPATKAREHESLRGEFF